MRSAPSRGVLLAALWLTIHPDANVAARPSVASPAVAGADTTILLMDSAVSRMTQGVLAIDTLALERRPRTTVVHGDLPISMALVGPGRAEWIAFESDSLLAYALAHPALIERGTRVRLRDGRWLRVDARTPAGTYALPRGGSLRLAEGRRLPRSGTWIVAPDRALFFAIQSGARVGGLVVHRDDASRSDKSGSQFEELAATYLRGLASTHGVPRVADGDSVVAFEFPRDWHRRAYVAFPPEARRPARIVWIAYGDHPTSTAWVPPDVGEYRRNARPTAAMLRATGRVIGAVDVDLVSGRIALVRP